MKMKVETGVYLEKQQKCLKAVAEYFTKILTIQLRQQL